MFAFFIFWTFNSFLTSSENEVRVRHDHARHHLQKKCPLRLLLAAILQYYQVKDEDNFVCEIGAYCD